MGERMPGLSVGCGDGLPLLPSLPGPVEYSEGVGGGPLLAILISCHSTVPATCVAVRSRLSEVQALSNLAGQYALLEHRKCNFRLERSPCTTIFVLSTIHSPHAVATGLVARTRSSVAQNAATAPHPDVTPSRYLGPYISDPCGAPLVGGCRAVACLYWRSEATVLGGSIQGRRTRCVDFHGPTPSWLKPS